MRSVGRVLLVAAMLLPGCYELSSEEHDLERRGLSKEDLEAPPNDNEIRARVITDVRTTWLPMGQLEQGVTACPAIRFVEGKPVCAADESPIRVYQLRSDPPDRQFPVEETAYFCLKENSYWYRYVGGPNRKDVWLGPRRVKLRQPQHD